MTNALKTEKPHIHITLSLWQTLDLLLWLCCAFLPLSHAFPKMTAVLFLNVIGSDICTALVAWYRTCVHCSLASLLESHAVLQQPRGWPLMFQGGGRCVGCCLVLVLGRWDVQLCAAEWCALGPRNDVIMCCFPPITPSKLQ